MRANEWDVIILKPTYVFTSFLATQLSIDVLPNFRSLQTDNTAYLIKKQKNDEETLNEIERHFARMFKHEIKRWLGVTATSQIDSSFLDFLCCFKFELHSHLVLMENHINEGKMLLKIKPKTVLLKWMKSSVSEDNELCAVLQKINLSHLAENATVLIKNFTNLQNVKLFLREYYHEFFQAEMLRVCNEKYLWPQVSSYQDFCRYFTVETHTQLIHLS